MDDKEIFYQINGAIFEVNRMLGSGFLEKVYENALIRELRLRGLNVEAQVPTLILHRSACKINFARQPWRLPTQRRKSLEYNQNG